MKSIRVLLRQVTGASHTRLEATMGLGDPSLSIERYGQALQVLQAIRAGWEPQLATVLPEPPGAHLAWLEQDLHHLGLGNLPPAPPLDLGVAAEAWGVRYVLEGSALGGRVLLRTVAPLGLTPEHGARYFAGEGAQTGPRWSSFLARLDTAATPAATPAIINGAELAFDTLSGFAASHMRS